MNRCPVCGYDNLPYPPVNYHICPCCGTEFGNDDSRHTHAELRHSWIERGAPWFFYRPPADWNPWLQLISAGFGYAVPFQAHLYVNDPDLIGGFEYKKMDAVPVPVFS